MSTSRKISVDLVFNYASLAVLAVSGLALNTLVARFYTPETLGEFNQLFAYYIVASQIAVLGIHHSVLREVALWKIGESASPRTVLSSALLLSSLLGIGVSATTWGASYYFWSSLRVISPALFFFALNKVLLGCLNGRQSMRWFAIAQAWRYVALVGFIALCCWRGWGGETLAYAFLVAEGSLFLPLLLLNVPLFREEGAWITKGWILRHLSFGSRAALSGVFLDLNSRVDVLMLGFYLGTRDVGIYSYAAVFAEGYVQLLVTARNLINPVLAQTLRTDGQAGVERLVEKLRPSLYLGMFAVALCVLAGFGLLLHFSVKDEAYVAGWGVLILLVSSVWLISGWLPFDGVFLAAGKPEQHTLLIGSILVSNIFLSLVLIPFFGILGAAMANGSSFVLGAVYLKRMLNRKMGIRLAWR